MTFVDDLSVIDGVAASGAAGTLSPSPQAGQGSAAPTPNGRELSPEEERAVRELQRTDAQVRRHEQAHAVVGGRYAGAPTYQFVRGPDGQNYAVAGEVSIDVSPEADPEATLRKMEVVRRAALAPAQPSAQDRAVAARASALAAQARAEIRAENTEGGQSDAGTAAVPDSEPARLLNLLV